MSENVLGKRALRRKERTAEILNASIILIEEGGFSNLTMPKLADRLDAAVGALYRYFRSKDQLLIALQKLAVGRYARTTEAEFQALSRDAEARKARGQPLNPGVFELAALRNIVTCWPEFALKEPNLFRLVDTALSTPSVLLSDQDDVEVLSEADLLFRRFHQFHQGAVAAGVLEDGDVDQRTWLAFGVIHGLTHFRKRDSRQPPKLQADVLIEQGLAAIFASWGADLDAYEQACRWMR